MFDVSTTLCGGSLGSCVDEERSQLCELMRTAYCFEHRHLERILRPRVSLWPRLSEGRLINYRDAQKVAAWVLPAGVISPIWSCACGVPDLWRFPNILGRTHVAAESLDGDVATESWLSE